MTTKAPVTMPEVLQVWADDPDWPKGYNTKQIQERCAEFVDEIHVLEDERDQEKQKYNDLVEQMGGTPQDVRNRLNEADKRAQDMHRRAQKAEATVAKLPDRMEWQNTIIGKLRAEIERLDETERIIAKHNDTEEG